MTKLIRYVCMRNSLLAIFVLVVAMVSVCVSITVGGYRSNIAEWEVL